MAELSHPLASVELGAWLMGPGSQALGALAVASPIVAFVPIIGQDASPKLTRLALLAVITIAIAPGLSPGPDGGRALSAWLGALVVYGGVVTLIARLMWEAALIAPALLDTVLGRGSMGAAGVVSAEESGPFTNLGGLASLALLCGTGAHLSALEAVATGAARLSEGSTSVLRPFDLAALAPQAIIAFDHAFAGAFALVATALAVSLTVDLTLGWANRTLPSLPAMFIAMPVRAALGWTLAPAILVASASLARTLIRALGPLLEALTRGLPT